MDNVKCKKHETSIMFIVTKAVYGVGFGILGLTAAVLLFLSIIANYNIFKPQIFAIIEEIIFWSYIAVVIILTITIPFFTSKKLRRNGQNILYITQKIKEQNLDFEVSYGNVKEINEILKSMDDMRAALKDSLEKQWRLEQNRKNQISALAHDFKTPMTILKGNIDLINGIEGSEGLREYIDDAKFSLEQMEKYLDMLLNMTRAEKGYTIKLMKVELCTMINEIVAPLQSLADKKNINLKVENKKEGIEITADRLLFERVINNLISNSFDFIDGEGSILIQVDKNEDNAVICIIDSGSGFSDSTLKHGTEQFFMGDISRNRKNHYGLGLFISDCIIKQHNGTMQLSNDKFTKGAKIIINIPLIKNN